MLTLDKGCRVLADGPRLRPTPKGICGSTGRRRSRFQLLDEGLHGGRKLFRPAVDDAQRFGVVAVGAAGLRPSRAPFKSEDN